MLEGIGNEFIDDEPDLDRLSGLQMQVFDLGFDRNGPKIPKRIPEMVAQRGQIGTHFDSTNRLVSMKILVRFCDGLDARNSLL